MISVCGSELHEMFYKYDRGIVQRDLARSGESVLGKTVCRVMIFYLMVLIVEV
jgi:hypothetical protein